MFAQKKWYVSFDAGYAFKMSSQNIYYYDNSDCDLELEFHNYIAHSNSDELEEAYATREQINTIAMSYVPNNGTLVEYTENGKDELSD